MRTPGITAKLFLALLGVTLTVVVVMTLATQLAFRSDFLEYLADRERARVAALADVLADHYRDHGDWQALTEAARWREALREAAWRHRRDEHHGREEDDNRRDHDAHHRDDDHHERGVDGDHGREWREHDGGPPHRRDARAPGPPRFGPTLLDAAQRRVAGPPVRGDGVETRPIVVRGETVGWLAFMPADGLTDRLAEEFREEQLEAAWVTALGVVVLAGGVSVLLARGFLAPVRRLAGSMRALAAGRFDTRVNEPRRDELGQLAADFNRLAETLQRNERLRRDFMADVSHELRTPMAVLRAELEAMEDGVRPLTRASLARLQGSVAALSKLISDLYELSLADAGALDYRLVPLDLNGLIETTAEQWRDRLTAAGLALSLELPAAPVTVSADERRLPQLLGNLLENSARYTDSGGEVHIALTSDADEAVVTVEDTAPGVPPEALTELFERLYRVEASRSRASGGAGLGLAICRNIAAAHGGRIEAYNAPRGGLGVRLTLPLARPSGSEA